MNFDKLDNLGIKDNERTSPAHKNYEMSKTVINRTCKRLINTSSDAILMDDELLDDGLPTDTAK
jgi:hypothetical protein